MSEIQVIESALSEAANRRRWERALRGLWKGLLVGAIASLLLLGAYHVLPLPLWVLPVAALIPLPCMLVGLMIGGWRKPVLKDVARWVDGRQRLKERLSTALEVSDDPNPGKWRDLIVTDAAEHVKGIDPRQLVPFRLPRSIRWALLLLALGAGLGFVPEYRTKSYLQKQTDQQNIKAAGKQLTELVRHDIERRPPALVPTQKALESVSELGDQLSKKALTRTEALKDLANVAEKLKDQIKELGKDPALRKMEQAARAASGGDSQSLSAMQKQLEALQKQLGTPTGDPDAMEKFKEKLDKLKEAAQGMKDKGSAATEAEKQNLSEALSALSKQAQEMGLQLPQLDDAIKALAANQPDLVLKDLQASVNDLEKMRDMAKSMQQLQQQMDKMGKDLAEQLKNGQPEAAQQTLQKMVDQLKQSNLSKEQLQQIMKDVAQAIKPAGNYGSVSDQLKQAGEKMQAGDKAGASQSLSQAADELGKLMQQMGDAQQMASTLEAMNQASMYIANGQGWKFSNRPGGFNPKNGGAGGGVGTWAGEGKEWNGEFNDHWDNSGIVQDTLDPMGHTERDANLNDALKPTKVKGQFSQGGPMPSITLKGVSIKGQSTVNYQEAAATAQSDAQSALSQEKVPRAYRGAVKDYFDDLKK
jgi:hypothetical protein